MREYHIDTHLHCQNYIAEPCKMFGGNLIVRKIIDQRPVIILVKMNQHSISIFFQRDSGNDPQNLLCFNLKYLVRITWFLILI